MHESLLKKKCCHLNTFKTIISNKSNQINLTKQFKTKFIQNDKKCTFYQIQ